MEEGKMAENTDLTPSEPLRLKPVDTRRATDIFFILLLPLSLLLWLGIGTYEFLANPYLSISEKYDALARWYFKDLPICGVIALLVIFFLILTLSVLRDNWVVSLVKIFIIIATLGLVALTLWQLALIIDWSANVFILIFLIIYLVYHVAAYICTKEIGATVLGPMIRAPFKAITRSFAACLFTLLIICLLTVVFITTVILILIMKYLVNRDPTSQEQERQHSIWIRIIPFALGGLYIFNFIWNFGFMVLGDHFANYYGNQKETHFWRSMGRVLRYHLGTVAFLATPVFPSTCALIVAFKSGQRLEKQSDYSFINFVSKTWLIIDISTYALIQTSIYGHKTLKSITEMFALHRKNSLLYLTLNAVPLKVVKISLLIVAGIVAIAHVALNFMGSDNYWETENRLFPTSSPLSEPPRESVGFGDRGIAGALYPLMKESHYMIRKDILLAAICVSFITIFLVRPAASTFAVYKMIGRSESKTPEEEPALSEQ